MTIRIGKPVQLFEWGIGTNTTNQIWQLVGTGSLIANPKNKMGVTQISVKLDGAFEKKNDRDDTIKVMQKGEGMTPASERWGEVAMSQLKSVEKEGSDTVVYLEIKNAIKIVKS